VTLGDPVQVLDRHVQEAPEHGRHRVVDPGFDGPELRLHGLGGIPDRTEVRDVDRQRDRPRAGRADLLRGRLQAVLATRDQPEIPAPPRQGTGGGATDAGGRARDHGDAMGGHIAVLPCVLAREPRPSRRRRRPSAAVSETA
jgi:hypothetical protein